MKNKLNTNKKYKYEAYYTNSQILYNVFIIILNVGRISLLQRGSIYLDSKMYFELDAGIFISQITNTSITVHTKYVPLVYEYILSIVLSNQFQYHHCYLGN